MTSRAKRTRIFVRDDWACQYCGRAVTHGSPGGVHQDCDATVDHIRPIHYGGSGDEDNLVTACNRCNNEKGGAFRDVEIEQPALWATLTPGQRARAVCRASPIFKHWNDANR